jgi:hypothetical protein
MIFIVFSGSVNISCNISFSSSLSSSSVPSAESATKSAYFHIIFLATSSSEISPFCAVSHIFTISCINQSQPFAKFAAAFSSGVLPHHAMIKIGNKIAINNSVFLIF